MKINGLLAIKDQVKMNGEPQIVCITREHLRASREAHTWCGIEKNYYGKRPSIRRETKAKM